MTASEPSWAPTTLPLTGASRTAMPSGASSAASSSAVSARIVEWMAITVPSAGAGGDAVGAGHDRPHLLVVADHHRHHPAPLADLAGRGHGDGSRVDERGDRLGADVAHDQAAGMVEQVAGDRRADRAQADEADRAVADGAPIGQVVRVVVVGHVRRSKVVGRVAKPRTLTEWTRRAPASSMS